MRRPAELVPWIGEVELQQWLRDAENVAEFQKRLTIWLVNFRRWSAKEIAEMIGVSVQAVWLWGGQYNLKGPQALQRKGRGGRRWSFLSWEEEKLLLKSFEESAATGKIITVSQLHAQVRQRIGKDVSRDYVYRLLHRHGWRKLGPRPRHVKNDPQRIEAFKKNSPPSSPKR